MRRCWPSKISYDNLTLTLTSTKTTLICASLLRRTLFCPMSRDRRRRREWHGGTTSGLSPEWHEREGESPDLTGAPIVTALPACHVGSHKNCRRVAPLSPHSRAHARQTIGVTLFMFSSGAPFPGIGAAGVIIEASCGSPRTHMQAGRPGGKWRMNY